MSSAHPSRPDSPIIGWGTPEDWEALLPLNYGSKAYEASCQPKSGPGLLFGFTIYSSLNAGQFILIFDSVGAPPVGTPAATVVTVAATQMVPANWIPPRTFKTGIYITNSTTSPTLTAGAANCFYDVQYL